MIEGYEAQEEEQLESAESNQSEEDRKPAGELISVTKLLPGVQVSTNALVVHQQRQQMYGHIEYSYSQAMQRVKQLATGELKKHHSEPSQNVSLLVRQKNEIATMHSQDALEAIRTKLGLDVLRSEILTKLRESLSFERGLERLSAWTQKNLGRHCNTIREANELFPNLTLSELAFFAILQSLPATMLYFGTAFDAQSLLRDTEAEEKAGMEEVDINAKYRVPQQVFGTTDGLAYTLDGYEPARQDHGNSLDCDPYSFLGFTGIRLDLEIVAYQPQIKTMIQQLIPLLLSNNRLYEKVWYSSPEALQVGFGKIAYQALERVIGDENATAALNTSLAVAIASLDSKQRQQFDRERQCLEETIAQASVYDLARDVALQPQEVIRLVGILDRTPHCLVQERPFNGYIQPYGASLKFITLDGKAIDQCPFSAWHQREAVQSIQAEMDDGGRENRTINVLFRELFTTVQGDIIDRFSQDEDSLSCLEAVTLKTWLEQGVVLQPLPIWAHEAVRNYQNQILNYCLTGKDVIARVTAKIGLEEAQQLATTLGLVPRKLLERVQRVIKAANPSTLASLMEGVGIEGYYNSGTETITLLEFPERPYSCIQAPEKAARSFTLLHECGEAVWTMLPADMRSSWKEISWKQKRRKLDKHFLTFYSHHKDEKEDFCDHLAAYILHGPEFRASATKAGPLKRKYRLIRRILTSLTGKILEFPRILPWTIEEIHGAIQQEIKRMELAEAIAFEEEREQAMYKENKDFIFEIRQTFEHLVSAAERAVEAEEIEDPMERQIAEQDDDNDDEEYEEGIETPDGYIEMHEMRAGVSEILESVMDREERQFRPLVDTITDYLLEKDWERIEEALEFLADDDLQEILELFEEINPNPQKPFK